MADQGGRRDDDLTLADVSKMIEILRASGWREVRLKMGDFELELSDGVRINASDTDAPATSASEKASPDGQPELSVEVGVPPASAPPAVTTANSVVVKAPTIGVFWRSPQPGASPFVEVGDDVDENTPLAIIEVMKMMTRLPAGCRGRVAAIHVENGSLVEFGQPVITIATDAR